MRENTLTGLLLTKVFDIFFGMRKHLPLRLVLYIFPLFILSAILFVPFPALSSVIRVTPVTMVLDKDFKNGMLWVMNEGDEPIQIEVRAMKWTQDKEGKDVYKDTKDLIFFPKNMKIGKGEQRSIRAGIKSSAIFSEQTYRLFIKEMAEAPKGTRGSEVRFAIQFGVPIFVKPIKREELKGEITNFAHGNGGIKVDVHNTGNVHFIIKSVRIKGVDSNGAETFSENLSGWYLLAGAARSYRTPFTQEDCLATAKFTVVVTTDQLILHEELDAIKTLCLP